MDLSSLVILILVSATTLKFSGRIISTRLLLFILTPFLVSFTIIAMRPSLLVTAGLSALAWAAPFTEEKRSAPP